MIELLCLCCTVEFCESFARPHRMKHEKHEVPFRYEVEESPNWWRLLMMMTMKIEFILISRDHDVIMRTTFPIRNDVVPNAMKASLLFRLMLETFYIHIFLSHTILTCAC